MCVCVCVCVCVCECAECSSSYSLEFRRSCHAPTYPPTDRPTYLHTYLPTYPATHLRSSYKTRYLRSQLSVILHSRRFISQQLSNDPYWHSNDPYWYSNEPSACSHIQFTDALQCLLPPKPSSSKQSLFFGGTEAKICLRLCFILRATHVTPILSWFAYANTTRTSTWKFSLSKSWRCMERGGRAPWFLNLNTRRKSISSARPICV